MQSFQHTDNNASMGIILRFYVINVCRIRSRTIDEYLISLPILPYIQYIKAADVRLWSQYFIEDMRSSLITTGVYPLAPSNQVIKHDL